MFLVDMIKKAFFRKTSIFMVFFFLIMFSLSAVGIQKVYNFSDYEYIECRSICLQAGVAYPSVQPVTGTELAIALSRVDDGKIGKELLERKNNLLSLLEHPNMMFVQNGYAFDIGGSLSPEIYIHNEDLYEFESFIPYHQRKPFAELHFEAGLKDQAYLYFKFEEKDSLRNIANKIDYHTNFTSILDYDKNTGQLVLFGRLSQAFQPFHAGISIGNDLINFQMVGDNFVMQEYLKLSFFSPWFGYDLDLSIFDQQNGPLSFSKFTMSGYHQYRIMHRFSFAPLSNLSISATLGGIYQVDGFDIRILTPMMLVHSFNNFSDEPEVQTSDEGNNIMSLEISWNFCPGWMFHTQVAMDQLQLRRESGDIPNAFGFLFNIQNDARVSNGNLHSHIEAVYTMPYLYLNYKTDDSGTLDYNYDFILGHWLSWGSEIQYSGYRYGPDVFMLSVGSDYYTLDWTIGGDVSYRFKGMHGIPYYPGIEDTFENYFKNESQPNIYEHTIQLSVGGSYTFDKMNITLSSSFFYCHIWNYHHEKGRQHDNIMFQLGLSYMF